MTEIPPKVDLGDERHDVPVLLLQLQDDLARSRLREAFWISLVFHLLLVIALVAIPKYVPGWSKAVAVVTPEQVIRDRELTYLDLPKDTQKPERAPKTDIISDKDRIATSRRPVLDRKVLEKLRDSRRPGPPGLPQPPAAGEQAMVQPPPARNEYQPGHGITPPESLHPPTVAQQRGVFGKGPMLPGAAIEQATRAVAAGRTAPYGSAGDYGAGEFPKSQIQSNLDILSDTMGVDFGPYLSRVLHDVRLNWYHLIPEVARAPMMKKGKVSIDFAISKDGRVEGMRLTGPSGDVALDRAAWGGITGSNPFPPLPNDFRGDYLALRFHFYYNPDRNELR